MTTPRHRARDIILRYGWNSTAYQILNPGIELWFAHTTDAVIGFVASGGFRIVAGEPVCAPEHLATIIAEFEDDARRQNKQVCYFCAQDRLVKLLVPHSTEYLNRKERKERKGRTAGQHKERDVYNSVMNVPGAYVRVAIGAQPVWNPQQWPSIVKSKSSLRAQIARARNKQITIARWSCEQSHNHPLLARCLNEWLHTRGLPPMHFLVEPDTLACLGCRHTYVASRGEHVVAFLVASPISLRNGWLIEQIVRCKDAPNGTAEYLIDYAMRDLAAEGASYATLGLSPLSRRAEIPLPMQPLWLRLLFVWTRSHGRRFYNFDGLDAFKAKMLPDYWEPVYAITNELQFSPRALYAIARAFSGMSPVLFVGRGVWRAVRQEVRWLLHV